MQPTFFKLSGFGNKGVEIKITMEETSNDGGLLLLLREVETQVGLIRSLVNCIKCLYCKSGIYTLMKRARANLLAAFRRGEIRC